MAVHGNQSNKDVCDTLVLRNSWWWRNVPVVLVRCDVVSPGYGGGYGRLLEFIAAHFSECKTCFSAAN
jgi:hypothetical protein